MKNFYIYGISLNLHRTKSLLASNHTSKILTEVTHVEIAW